MKKTAEFNVYKNHKTGTTRRVTGEVYRDNGITVWVYIMENFTKRIIKRHKAKHDVVFI